MLPHFELTNVEQSGFLNAGGVVNGKDRLWRCVRDCDGSPVPVRLLDVAALALAGGAYALNRLAHAGHFFSSYFDDVLAGAILLAWAGLLAPPGSGSAKFVRSPLGALIIIAGASFVWEVLVPIVLPRSIGDPLDVLAYFAGAALYLGIWRAIAPMLFRARQGKPCGE
jgi:hypothetical protein